MFTDAVMIGISYYLALFIRFEGEIQQDFWGVFLDSFIVLSVLEVVVFFMFGLYKNLWQYAGTRELMQIFLALSAGSVVAFSFGAAADMMLPRSVYAIEWLLLFMLLGASRFGGRVLKKAKRTICGKKEQKRRVMIIGAGEAGHMLIKELKNRVELKTEPVVVIDDDKWKQKASINGIPVAGDRTRIVEMAERYHVDEIVIAIPSAGKKDLSDIIQICKETKCRLKTLPGVYELMDEEAGVRHIRDVSIEDLLGRDEIILNTEEVAGYLKDEVVLVTGGGGSIGSELCRQISRYSPRKLIVFDIYENNAYDLQNELLQVYKNKIDLEVLIGSVREKERLRQVFARYRPGVVFHAAAHKHVPLMEHNPAEAIKNNVIGTLNTAQCADEFGVKKFVLISTDKAVNPTNIMGATKRMAEMIVQSLDKVSNTEFAAVRFGNVLGSNGSVIPLFKRQIAAGGPVTVTHPEIIRYFMTIPEAARLVIQAGAMAEGGEIFVLDMGQPVKIVDLAADLIKLSGLVPGEDIKVEFTGLRPGEKLYEELLMAEEGLGKTRNEKIYIAKPIELSYDEVLRCVKALEKCLGDSAAVRECLGRVVPTYNCTYDEAAAGKE
jgi:FlaA1/EpsC-like NDP-sugar epimerase